MEHLQEARDQYHTKIVHRMKDLFHRRSSIKVCLVVTIFG